MTVNVFLSLMIARRKGSSEERIHLAFPGERFETRGNVRRRGESDAERRERYNNRSGRGLAVSDEQLIGRLQRSMGSRCSCRQDIDAFLNCIHNRNVEVRIQAGLQKSHLGMNSCHWKASFHG